MSSKSSNIPLLYAQDRLRSIIFEAFSGTDDQVISVHQNPNDIPVCENGRVTVPCQVIVATKRPKTRPQLTHGKIPMHQMTMLVSIAYCPSGLHAVSVDVKKKEKHEGLLRVIDFLESSIPLSLWESAAAAIAKSVLSNLDSTLPKDPSALSAMQTSLLAVPSNAPPLHQDKKAGIHCIPLSGDIKISLEGHSPGVDEVDWGGVQLRIGFDWEMLKQAPSMVDLDGVKADLGESLYAFLDTLGVSDKDQTKAMGGGDEPLSTKVDDIIDIPGTLAEGSHYNLKIFTGDEKNHHGQCLIKKEFTVHGGPSHRERMDVYALSVKVRKDGKIQYRNKVYDNMQHITDGHPHKGIDLQVDDLTNSRGLFLLKVPQGEWPPLYAPDEEDDEDDEEGAKLEGIVSKRVYQMEEVLSDDAGLTLASANCDPWELREKTVVVEDTHEEEKHLKKIPKE